jgi:hypothetical protein
MTARKLNYSTRCLLVGTPRTYFSEITPVKERHKSETVIYDRKYQGTRIREDCAGKGQQYIQKTDPSSR